MNLRGLLSGSKSRRRSLYWAVAFLLAAVLLYFSLRGLDWRHVWLTLSHARPAYVALWIALGFVTLFLRALRWRILLRSAAPVTVSTAFWATAAGYFGNNYLPARAGELIRSVMVSAQSGLTKTFVLTTALAERMSDAVALVLISSLVLLALPSPPGWFARAARPFAAIGLCGALAIGVAPKLERLWTRVLARLSVPDRLKEKLSAALLQILTGMRAFHSARRLLAFAAFTAVIWLGDAVAAVVGAYALHLHLALPVAFLLVAGLGLGSALPATPGYVGIYQFVAVSVLDPFGWNKSDAIAFILLSQALQYVGTAFWGLLAFAQARRIGVNSAAVAAEAGPDAASSRIPN
jgi:uncharacterized protein (TIRG00374 family)